MKQQHFLRTLVIDNLLILLFAPVLFVYYLTHTKNNQALLFPWSSVLWSFVCDMHIFMGWFQRSIVRKLSHLCVYPIVNWSEMKQILCQPNQPLCCVKFTIKYIPRLQKHQPTADKIEYLSYATVTQCWWPLTEKNTNYRWQQTETITLRDSSMAQNSVKVLRMVLIKMLKTD